MIKRNLRNIDEAINAHLSEIYVALFVAGLSFLFFAITL